MLRLEGCWLVLEGLLRGKWLLGRLLLVHQSVGRLLEGPVHVLRLERMVLLLLLLLLLLYWRQITSTERPLRCRLRTKGVVTPFDTSLP